MDRRIKIEIGMYCTINNTKQRALMCSRFRWICLDGKCVVSRFSFSLVSHFTFFLEKKKKKIDSCETEVGGVGAGA